MDISIATYFDRIKKIDKEKESNVFSICTFLREILRTHGRIATVFY
jgi:hypothetical protein